MLYIRAQNSFILQLEVCTLWPTSPYFPQMLALGNHYSFYSVSEFVFYNLDSTYKGYHIVFVFL